MSQFGYQNLGFGSGVSAPASSFDPSTMSAEFDGSDDYLAIGTSAIALDTNFTMSAWIYSHYHGGYRAIMGWGGDNFSYPTDAGKLRQLQLFSCVSFELWGSRITGSTVLSTYTWYHVAATLSGNDVKVYLNGAQDGSGTLSRSSFSTSTTYIGGMPPAYSGGFANFDGLIDEAAVFDSVLSGSQIASIYNSGVPGDLSPFSPVGWWRMGDGTGDTDSGGGAPANTDAIGTVVDQAGSDNATGSDSNHSNADGANGPKYSSTVPVPSFSRYSLSLDGTNEYATNESLSSTLTVEGVSLWFKPDLAYQHGGSTSWILGFGGLDSGIALAGNWFGVVTNELISVANANHIWSYTSTSALSTSTWYHLAIRWESSSSSTNSGNAGYDIFLNGTKVGNAFGTWTSGTGAKISADRLTVGARNRSGTIAMNYDGFVDEVAIFDSAISEADITAIYNSGVPADLTSYSPATWWRMGDNDGGTGTTITDQGSGGNDGTLTNGPTFSSTTP